MKMHVTLLLSMVYCGSLISGDQRIGVVSLNQVYNPGQPIVPTQCNNQQQATIVGTVTLLESSLPRNSHIIMDTENGKFQELDKAQFYAFNKAKQVWEVARQQIVNQKNWIESGAELVSNFSRGNIVIELLSLLGCARSFSCLTWALGTPALTQQYLCWHLFVALSSSAMGKVSYVPQKNKESNYSLGIGLSCLFGGLVGCLSR